VSESRVMHKYSTQHDSWTLCGRYVSSNEGSIDVMASEINEEVTCRACLRSKVSLLMVVNK